MDITEKWQSELRKASKPEKIKILSSFFKTQKGGYGEGDIFIGLQVPDNRNISKRYFDVPFGELEKMLSHPIHEFRIAALFALVERFKKSKKDDSARRAIIDFYLAHTAYVNNWDLVDLSCPQIIGQYMLDTKSDEMAQHLVSSSLLWEQRISIVSTFTLIKNNKFDTTINIATKLLSHPHDLIHKAVGWMLREVGKRDIDLLRHFLNEHATTMPRTALRYAIEKMDTPERTHYLNLKQK